MSDKNGSARSPRGTAWARMSRRQRTAFVTVAVLTVVVYVVDGFTETRWLGAVGGLGVLTISLIGLFSVTSGPLQRDTSPDYFRRH